MLEKRDKELTSRDGKPLILRDKKNRSDIMTDVNPKK